MPVVSDIKIKSRFKIKTIEELEIRHEINDHCRMNIKCIVENIGGYENQIAGEMGSNICDAISASCEDDIQVFDSENLIFSGFIENFELEVESGLNRMEIMAIGASYILDIEKRTRSFQNPNMTYRDILKVVGRSYASFGLICTSMFDRKIEYPIIQYKETDFEFIKRIASFFGEFIYNEIKRPDPCLYIGCRETKLEELTDEIRYKSVYDFEKLKNSVDCNNALKKMSCFHYDIDSMKRYDVGQSLNFRRRDFCISKMEAKIIKGEFIYAYRLSKKEALEQNKKFNNLIRGNSIKGKVLDSRGENLKLHLEIDENQSMDSAWWYVYSPLNSNAMYSMPEAGTFVNLYFATDDEKDSFCDCSLMLEDGSCSGKREIDRKHLENDYGKILSMRCEDISFESSSGNVIGLCSKEDGGISIRSNESIIINGEGDIEIETPKSIRISGDSRIDLSNGRIRNGIFIEGSFNFLGNHILNHASERTTYQPFEEDEPEMCFGGKFNLLDLMVKVVSTFASVATMKSPAHSLSSVIVSSLSAFSESSHIKETADSLFEPNAPVEGEFTDGAVVYSPEDSFWRMDRAFMDSAGIYEIPQGQGLNADGMKNTGGWKGEDRNSKAYARELMDDIKSRNGGLTEVDKGVIPTGHGLNSDGMKNVGGWKGEDRGSRAYARELMDDIKLRNSGANKADKAVIPNGHGLNAEYIDHGGGIHREDRISKSMVKELMEKYELAGHGVSLNMGASIATGSIMLIRFYPEKLGPKARVKHDGDWRKPFVYIAKGIDFSTIGSFKGVIEAGEMMIRTGGNFKSPKPSADMTYVQVLKRKDYEEFDPENVKETGTTLGATVYVFKYSHCSAIENKVHVNNYGISTPGIDLTIGGTDTQMIPKEESDRMFDADNIYKPDERWRNRKFNNR